MEVIFHTKSSDRSIVGVSWKNGWTIGSSSEHYRCITCYIPTTKSEINCDTLAFFPHNIQFPKVNTKDYLKQTTQAIISLLTNPIASLPYLQIGDTTKNALLDIVQILNRSITNIVPLQQITPKKNFQPNANDRKENKPTSPNSTTTTDKSYRNIDPSKNPRMTPTFQNTVRLPRVQREHPPPPGYVEVLGIMKIPCYRYQQYGK